MSAPARAHRHAGAWNGLLERAWQSRTFLSVALWPLAFLFGVVSAARRGLYTVGLLRAVRLPVPVVVVGNLIVGGAGKTPTVLAIIDLLRANGYAPGVVSRGYGRVGSDVMLGDSDASALDVGDEPLLLRRRSGVPVAVGVDRVAAGHALLRAHA